MSPSLPPLPPPRYPVLSLLTFNPSPMAPQFRAHCRPVTKSLPPLFLVVSPHSETLAPAPLLLTLRSLFPSPRVRPSSPQSWPLALALLIPRRVPLGSPLGPCSRGFASRTPFS